MRRGALAVFLLMSWCGQRAMAESLTLGYPNGRATYDGQRATMTLKLNGANVTGTLEKAGACGSNIRLTETTLVLTGTLRGTWEGTGTIAGNWTGGDTLCGRRLTAADGYPQQGTFTISMRGTTVQLLRTGAPPLPSGWTYDFGATGQKYDPPATPALGRVWRVVGAGGWRAVWTRRGMEPTFDGVWTGPRGQRVTTVVTVETEGHRVRATRTSSSDGTLCRYAGDYTAPLEGQGGSVRGTAQCDRGAPWSWHATIDASEAGPPPTPAAGPGLGRVWRVVGVGGWSAVWTRRGTGNTFDGVWSGPQKQRVTTVVTVEMDGRSVRAIRTSSSDGTLCKYTGDYGGPLEGNGGSVLGTAQCDKGGPWNWRATIER